MQAAKTNQWLVFRRPSKNQRVFPVIDKNDRMTEAEIRQKSGIGSKMFKVTRYLLFRLWRLMVQSDPSHYLDWHASSLVANVVLSRSRKRWGYSCGHSSFQIEMKQLPDEYHEDLMTEADLWNILNVQ